MSLHVTEKAHPASPTQKAIKIALSGKTQPRHGKQPIPWGTHGCVTLKGILRELKNRGHHKQVVCCMNQESEDKKKRPKT